MLVMLVLEFLVLAVLQSLCLPLPLRNLSVFLIMVVLSGVCCRWDVVVFFAFGGAVWVSGC